MSADTKLENVKTCSKCEKEDIESKFVKNRNICKECQNKRRCEIRRNYLDNMPTEGVKTCNTCGLERPIANYLVNNNMCLECRNKKRCLHYKNDEEFREKRIETSIIYKKKKAEERAEIKKQELK